MGETDYLLYQPPTSVLTSVLAGGGAVIDLPTRTGARAQTHTITQKCALRLIAGVREGDS